MKNVQEQGNPSTGPPKQMKRILWSRVYGAERIKLLLLECVREYPKPIGKGAIYDTGGLPGNRRATDFRNIQGGSAIPWNTVTITGCDCRVNRVVGEEG